MRVARWQRICTAFLLEALTGQSGALWIAIGIAAS